ncbi:hypothetical protein ACJ72_06172 [Emergomyces africanus]|uniref:C2H2-type domain-containing protein n=1 Tax=Emergomyces africanus TaxID=1955775 RepID=A0A1B7NS61_9EURO|nr:hypothetical protein ACJ72_06172 [Emergomyces africanus]
MAVKNPAAAAPNCVDSSMCGGVSQTEYCSAYPSCQEADPCCDEDNCSVQCSSVCDGFVACDASTICSEMLCEAQDCHSAAPVCFDQSCIGDSHAGLDDRICDILNQDSSFNWNSEDLLQSPNSTHFNGPFHTQHGASSDGVSHDTLALGNLTPSETSLIPKNYAFQFHQDQNSSLQQQSALTELSTSSGSIINQIIDLCPTLGNCNHQSHFGPIFSDCNPDEFLGFVPMEFQSQFHSLYPQLYPRYDGGLKLPCEMQPEHVHKGTSRPSQHIGRPASSTPLSTQPNTSPSITPLSKCSDITSSFTSPDVESINELHICKCIIKNKSQNNLCGATFPDAARLKDAKDMDSTVVGRVVLARMNPSRRNKGFQCSACGKQFARQATLERHERSHRGEKPYACSICQKAFTDSSELKTHMRIHTGEKPFKCSYPGCTFETGDSSNMSSHKLTHGVRKHKCTFPGCSKSFTRPDQLKRHIKMTHKADTYSSASRSSPTVNQSLPLKFEPPSENPSLPGLYHAFL